MQRKASKDKIVKSSLLLVVFVLFLSFPFKSVISENSIYSLKIPDNWYYFYLVPRGNYNFPRDNIYVGQPARIFVFLQNTGTTEANGTARVRIEVSDENGRVVFARNSTDKYIRLLPRLSELFTFDLTFNSSEKYTITAKSFVFIGNKTVETSEQQISILPKPVRITLFTNVPSLNILIKVPELSIEKQINGSYPLDVPFKNVTIVLVNNSVMTPQAKYVLASQNIFRLVADYTSIKFKEEVSGNTYDITGSIELPIVYNTFYNYSIITKNKSLSPIGANISIQFPNGSTVWVGTPYNGWLQNGTYKILNATYENYDVLPYRTVFYVTGSGSKEIVLDVDDQVIKVVNSFINLLNFPIEGADVSVTFYNGTSRTLKTNASGIVLLSQIPLGKIKGGYVVYKVLGISQNVTITPYDKIVTVNVYLSYPIITLLATLTLVILVSVLVIILKSKIEKVLFGTASKKETPSI
ncbi:MAG: hypothetical protein ACPLRT_09180 [Thermoproteota archaeon]